MIVMGEWGDSFIYEYYWTNPGNSFETIYAYKTKLDSTYRHILKAKKNKANINLTYFVGRIYEIFIDHT